MKDSNLDEKIDELTKEVKRLNRNVSIGILAVTLALLSIKISILLH